MIDLHAHILPGLDDGPKKMDDTLELCRIAVEDGIHTIVATPHMFNELYSNTREGVLKSVDELRKRLLREDIPLEILPGADTHITSDLPHLIAEGKILTVGDGGRYLLLELPSNLVPQGVEKLLFSLRLRGITAIITHPERNGEIQSNPETLESILKGGHLAQITASSFTGKFGEEAEKCAEILLNAGLCHVVASDCHSGYRPPVLSEAREIVESLVGKKETRAIFYQNPRRILAGKDIGTTEPATLSMDKKGSWFRRIWS